MGIKSMSEQVKMYITTYALTQGIYDTTGKVKDGYFYPEKIDRVFAINRDCFPALDMAVEQARKMAQRQLKSLEAKKQKINKLLDGDKFKVKNI